MLHVVVKWSSEESWDVYPLRSVLDTKVCQKLAKDPTTVMAYTGKAFDVRWDEDQEPSPAYIVAVGSQKAMEKVRARIASEGMTNGNCSQNTQAQDSSQSQNLELKRRIQELEEENDSLKKKLKQAEDMLETGRLVKHLRSIIKKVENQDCSRPTESHMEDIGGGVLVDKGLLARMKASNKDEPRKFARALLKAVFSPAELVNKSLYGRPSNVSKTAEHKDGLDPVRRDAVLNYTCLQYGVDVDKVKRSLSSMLFTGMRKSAE